MREMKFIKVYPTSDDSLSLPGKGILTHEPMTAEGASWPNDLFTKRRINDGSVTTEAPKAKSDDTSKSKADEPAASDDSSKKTVKPAS